MAQLNGSSKDVEAWTPLQWFRMKPGQYLGDPELETDTVLTLALVTYFLVVVFVFRVKTEKQKAWILTALSASSSFVFFFFNMYFAGVQNLPVDVSILKDTPFSRFSSRYFRVTLLVDLLLGVVFYPNQLNLLTSWFHHLAYFFLMNWAIKEQVTLCFSLFLVEELPTFLLALGSISKNW
eukprot:CAMPEP_0177600150 /NCGR_PEP_ID=MMETSP0419_2-20121207/13442_1 /TAXON_ID=582737 /ORGANISM="Tetraselmis sp., Strain GSL018" /LENGTH=179 /DNA_ID=CAMNT_0019093069 /DNA_START=40 /DNA_END=576 /DNA_ORIENTATION=-